jgi:hypothetical protein
MQQVWRVQNHLGFGPYYRSYQSAVQYEHAYANWKKDQKVCPDLPEDFPADWRMSVFRREEWLFGFPTKRAAIAWFGQEHLDGLASLGFQLVRVPARGVKRSISGKQVAFRPTEDHPAHQALNPA